MGAEGTEIPLEDLATPIVAWRGWTVRWYDGQLGLGSVMATPEGRVGMPLLTRSGAVIGTEDDRRFRWPPEGVEAECRCRTMNENLPDRIRETLPHLPAPGPPVPWTGDGFGCGVYAMKTPRELRDSVWAQFADVVGEVELGGRVWEHDLGYRAQHAKIRSLVAVTDGFMLRGMLGAGDGVREWRRQRMLLRELRFRYGLTEREDFDG